MARPWLVITLVLCGVIASISMIVVGWPEQTPVQIALLELAALEADLAALDARKAELLGLEAAQAERAS